MKISYKNLILGLLLSFLLGIFTYSLTKKSEIQIISNGPSTNSVTDRLQSLEFQVTKARSEDRISSKLDTTANLLSLYATTLLAVIAGIGGLVVWNGFQMREEAKKDVKEIRKYRIESAKMNTLLKKAADEAVESGNTLVKKLTGIISGAETKDQKLQEFVSDWQNKTTFYSNASVGTSDYFEPIQPDIQSVTGLHVPVDQYSGGVKRTTIDLVDISETAEKLRNPDKK
jgi:hypothetical protein